MPLANTPPPPYYAVVFTSTLKSNVGYAEEASKMVTLASQQPGFLGVESAREKEDVGITVSYWKDVDSIKMWKANTEHLDAQKNGHSLWYGSFKVRVAKVERDYGI